MTSLPMRLHGGGGPARRAPGARGFKISSAAPICAREPVDVCRVHRRVDARGGTFSRPSPRRPTAESCSTSTTSTSTRTTTPSTPASTSTRSPSIASCSSTSRGTRATRPTSSIRTSDPWSRASGISLARPGGARAESLCSSSGTRRSRPSSRCTRRRCGPRTPSMTRAGALAGLRPEATSCAP